MKDVGTLLIEIKKPVGDAKLVYRRLRALTRTVAQALNMTMQDSHGLAVAELRAAWDGESKAKRDKSEDWREHVRTKLAQNWNSRMERERADRIAAEPDADLVYAGINGSALAEETAKNITSQFNGENVKEMLALRKGFPQFGISSSFYCGGRFCTIAGTLKQKKVGLFATEEEAEEAKKAAGDGHFVQRIVQRAGDKWEPMWKLMHEDSARIALPLWGVGKKVTEFIIGPAGGHTRATWRQLVAHFERRDEVVKAEKELKKIRMTEEEKAAIAGLKAEKKAATDRAVRMEIKTRIQAAVEASRKRRQSLSDPIEARLYGLTKIGRIGVVWKERRRKWFVTVSYTRYLPPIETKGQAAAVNFGVNVFLQAVAADGVSYSVSGDQILHKRLSEYHARNRIQKSKRSFGRGSRGHGKRRRELPLTKRQGDESNWTENFIRTLAHDLISWCIRHGIADLYLEDLGGIRDAFEQATEGEANEEVKRRIHSWPFGKTKKAIVREGTQRGVRVHEKGARFVSRRCPECGHTDPANVQEIAVAGPTLFLRRTPKGLWESVTDSKSLIEGGELYRRQDKTWRFECQQCGKRGQSDVVACINHLQDVGALPSPGDPTGPGEPGGGNVTPLAKMQEAARAAVTNDNRKKIRRTGT